MFQNLPIRDKLIVILVGPLLLLTILSAVGIGLNISDSAKASRVNEMAHFSTTVLPLVHQLQQERDLSYQYIGSERKTGREQLTAQRRVVDRVLTPVRKLAASLDRSDHDRRVQAALTEGLERFSALTAQRQTIDRIPPDRTVNDALDRFDATIEGLLDINAAIAIGSDNEELLSAAATFDAFSRVEELADRERGFMTRVFSEDGFSDGDYERFLTIASTERLWSLRFLETATAEQRDLVTKAMAGPDVERAKELREIARSRANAPDLGVSPDAWWSAASGKIQHMRAVQVRLASDVITRSSAVQALADRRTFWLSIVLTAVLWGTIGLSLLAARVMVNPLVRLRDVANDVAHHRLPGLVDRLHEGETVDLQREVQPIGIRSKDEIGQLADAFNSVHRVAVTVAGEQAGLRKNIGDTFLNLARRSQSLTERQLEKIDELEQSETDPDALENLYSLDHLATRMRRNAENLIVLSGSETVRRWRLPIPLNDVIRAAIGEVEDYARVELIPTPDVAISGQVTGDVIHLLAELIENATSFSPPGTKVCVSAEPVSTGCVVEIEDKGIGMSDLELLEINNRLDNPPTMDFTLSKMLGFHVVGRLAARHGIRVQLRHSFYNGVIALVLIPKQLLVDMGGTDPSRSMDGRLLPSRPSAAGRNSEVIYAQPASQGGDGSKIDLPIFESARSDWLQAEHTMHVPLWRHPPRRHEEGQPDVTSWTSTQSPEPSDAEDSAFVDEDSLDGAPVQFAHPDGEELPRTSVGLPRRVPASRLVPGMAERPAPEAVPSSPTGLFESPHDEMRSPAGIRDRLSDYRRGLDRGRSAATGEADAAGAEGDTAAPFRSDDDASQ